MEVLPIIAVEAKGLDVRHEIAAVGRVATAVEDRDVMVQSHAHVRTRHTQVARQLGPGFLYWIKGESRRGSILGSGWIGKRE